MSTMRSIISSRPRLPVMIIVMALAFFGLLAGTLAHASDAYQRGLFLYRYTYEYQRARAEFEQAVERDRHPGAAFYLGEFYEGGITVPRDLATALRFYHTAAEQGHVLAQQRLAWFYLRGMGTPVDAKAAFIWYSRAAENGDLLSQMALSRLYLTGQGVAENIFEAYKWFSIAASYGHPDSEAVYALIAPHLTPAVSARAKAEAVRWERAYEAARKQSKPALAED